MKKLLFILTVLMLCWSCDVPGNIVDQEDSVESRGVGIPDPLNDDFKTSDPEDYSGGGSGSSTSSLAFPKPIPTNLPSVRVYLYNNSGYQYPLTVEGTTNMISGFKYLSSSVSASSIWGLSNLCDYNFNDQTSSIYVYNDTESIIKLYFYEHLNYGGAKDSMTVQPGGYESIHNLSNETMNSHTSWNDDITSLTVEIERPFTVTYCIDPHKCIYNSNLFECFQRTCYKGYKCTNLYCDVSQCFNSSHCHDSWHCHDSFCCHSGNHCHNDCYKHPCPGHRNYL